MRRGTSCGSMAMGRTKAQSRWPQSGPTKLYYFADCASLRYALKPCPTRCGKRVAVQMPWRGLVPPRGAA